MRNKQLLPEMQTADGRRMTKRDYIVLFVLLAVYSVVAFLNLGSVSSPQTAWTAEPGTTVIVDLGDTQTVTEMRFFGSIAEGELEIYDESAFINDYFTPGETEPLATFSQENGDMYKWTELSVETETRYLILYVESGKISMNEIAVLSGETLLPATVYDPRGGAEKLTDEQDKITLNTSYLDEMYFDEIYHARTAYEIIKNDDLYLNEGAEAAARDGYAIYEWTHPSLGKLFIAVGVRIFGMTPFGWRFSGTFFGVLILAVLYVFAKRIFRRTDYALVTAALFAADGMHFAQTRIATIDTYALFFTLLMFLFMGDYIAENFEKRPYWKKLAMLGLSGLMFGLGVASKWTCLYSGAGLAVLYFGDLIYNLVRIIDRRRQEKKALRELGTEEYVKRLVKMPVNVLAYAPVLFVFIVIVLHIKGFWLNAADYQFRSYANGQYHMRTNAQYGVDTINKIFLQPWFYGTLLLLIGVAIVSAVIFRFSLCKRDEVDLSLNDLLMTPVWCCLFFIVIPIAIYFVTNYCYYIKDGNTTLSAMLETLWRKQESMYRYHADLDATHLCQSMWYQWPLAQKSVWFYSGYPSYVSDAGKEIKLLSNISSTGNSAVWYVSAFGAVFAVVEWFKNPACRKDRAFPVVFVGILAGLLPWALVTRCVFLYHYFSTIPFMMLLTLLLLYYVEKQYPRTAWLKWAWLVASVIVFLLMLPAVSGIPVPYGYAKFIENVLAPFGKVYYVGV
ncbi:MAG: glycosyltransferase family 39 protein [Clostridia bacterium]|nr:glycosyltransferase family 39 protein [Clostridia bacterium]